ncbi:sensor histidine kinase [Idiomarina aquatica]|uniref:histidine kinase n=1 Tax=Idiomarina aquatica TaxID=1327752 RepID=A0AA94EF53_9GAMM|nr:PAS domain-containing sensor histidine kinase [Idiomarina aquatica]RUO42600.1 PAS domain-containing sensor histidine kinase [Idiomarina aquatica]
MQAHRSLIDAMPNAVILVDDSGVVEHCNDNAHRLLNAALVGRPWRDCVAEYFAPQADDWHEVSLHSGRRVKVDISALHDGTGQLIVLTDLTETRRLQQKISHLQRLSSMGRMVASLAHQIRTPLSAAILYAQNLAMPGLDDTRRSRFSDKLLSRLSSLEQQVNDMLLFAKSGDQQVLESLSADQLVDSVLASVQPYAKGKGVLLRVERHARALCIRANHTALSGAIQNLITNAIDASTAGQQVTMTLSEANGHWQCRIVDQGGGIPQHIQAQLFTPFVTTKANGTGLGLAVVNTVVKAHQGQLQWQSEEGKGTEFTLSFPVDDVLPVAKEVCYG